MPRVSRFKKRISDRSGFDYFEIGMLKDGASKVGADEFDAPPPSKLPLGGEGDISGEARADSLFTSTAFFTAPAGLDNPIAYITAAGGITPNTHPFMRVTGSNGAVDITSNPQISAGRQGQVLSLVCVDSRITLDHGTGLNMMGSSRFVMDSGAVISFFYSSGGSVWNETSRSRP